MLIFPADIGSGILDKEMINKKLRGLRCHLMKRRLREGPFILLIFEYIPVSPGHL